MPDLRAMEDEAASYVMGGLSPTQAKDFQARMAESPELRALVHELQEATVALSLAAPQREPSVSVWKEIEKSISTTKQPRRIINLRKTFSHSGWAAAAAIALAWAGFALWENGPGKSNFAQDNTRPAVSNSTVSVPEPVVTPLPLPVTPTPTETTGALLAERLQEIDGLRWEITNMNSRLKVLTRDLHQQQAMLNEPGRLKFYQLVPNEKPEAASDFGKLRPDLQRAMLLAVARELGWFGGGNTEATPAANTEELFKVNFVDLRDGANTQTNQSHQQLQNEPKKQTAEPTSLAVVNDTATSSTSVPAFATGDKLFVALDPAVAPAGSQITFTVRSENAIPITGTALMNNNPMVVTLPFQATAMRPWSVSVGTTSPGGTTTLQTFTAQPTQAP